MSTRAIQDPMQLLGFRDPTTDEWLAGGSVEFYAAGTLNAKEAWEDKDKASAITSVTLDSSGQAQVYFDGVYKFIVKNAAGTTRYTLDNLKFQARNTSTVTKTANYQATVDDDFILCDTDSGAFTITLAAVAGVVAPITIKNIGASSNTLTVDGSGAETIDGSASQALLDGGAQQYVTDGTQWYGAGDSRSLIAALVYTASGEVVETGAGESISSLTVDFDNGGWYSAGAPTRLTVPTGVTKVRVGGTIEFGASAGGGFRLASLNKNGSISYVGFTKVTGEPNATIGPYLNMSSGPITVVPGDYFEFFAQHDIGSDNTVQVNFWIEKVQS